MSRPEKARPRIVCLGDSITYGYPYGPQASWVHLASARTGLHLLNRGVNGDTSSQLYRRFERDVAAEDPTHVIILAGANDAWQNRLLSQYQENITAIITAARKAQIIPVAGLPTPVAIRSWSAAFPHIEGLEERAALLDSYRRWLSTYASTQGIAAIDFYTALLCSETGEPNESYFVDGVHPSREGYRQLAQVVEPGLFRGG